MGHEFHKTRETFVQGSMTLPQEFYVSPEIFALEQEKIINKDWVCAGHVSKIPNAGDYFIVNNYPDSAIVLRDKGGAVRSLHNVCRHKGTEIYKAGGKLSQSIQCSYHGWTYSLDGKLIGAPSMEGTEGFKKENYSLKKAPVHIWNGFIFVDLGLEKTTPFDEKYPGLSGKLTKWNMEKLKSYKSDKFSGTITYDVDANWKLMMENFNECYHCATLHPELNKVLDNRSGYNDLIEGPALGGYMELLPGKKSATMSGESCAIALGDLDQNELNQGYYYSIMPNLLLNVHPDYVVYHLATPIAPNKTKIVSEWLFNPESFDKSNFNPMDAIEFWDTTNKQDWGVCERGQRGISTHAYEPGPYSSRESLLAAFDRHYLNLLKS